MVSLDGGVTKLRISNRAIKRWHPGSHVLLSIPKFGFMQSHPAAILSIPQSHNGDLVFLLKGHGGFTKKVDHGATTASEALTSEKDGSEYLEANARVIGPTHTAIIDGPYGGSQSDFAAFDSALLISGSTSITFSLSLLQDSAERVTTMLDKKLPLHRLHLVWCVESSDSARWVSNEIAAASAKLHAGGIDVQFSIHVTCADGFTDHRTPITSKKYGCQCDKAKGPCCCEAVAEEQQVAATEASNEEIETAPTTSKALGNESATANSWPSSSSSSSSSFPSQLSPHSRPKPSLSPSSPTPNSIPAAPTSTPSSPPSWTTRAENPNFRLRPPRPDVDGTQHAGEAERRDGDTQRDGSAGALSAR